MIIKNKRAPGRRKKVYFNKGRQVDKLSLDEANGLLTNYFPLKKDMLIRFQEVNYSEFIILMMK